MHYLYTDFYISVIQPLIYPRYGQGPAAWRIRENGMASVGCSQFFESYVACGGESIIWNVYAKRVRWLVFLSDLCKTEP